jgi:hypothetical protein
MGVVPFRPVPNAATLSRPCMVTTALLRNSQKIAKDTKEGSFLRTLIVTDQIPPGLPRVCSHTCVSNREVNRFFSQIQKKGGSRKGLVGFAEKICLFRRFAETLCWRTRRDSNSQPSDPKSDAPSIPNSTDGNILSIRRLRNLRQNFTAKSVRSNYGSFSHRLRQTIRWRGSGDSIPAKPSND